jgi:hypothetical protein
MDAMKIIDCLRGIRSYAVVGDCAYKMKANIEALEHEIAGTDLEDFNACPVEGFDTILSYLSRTNPEAFDLIDQPVHGTIRDGVFATKYAHARGYPVLRVTAPPHMKRRFPRATHVNAYPTHMLVEIFG